MNFDHILLVGYGAPAKAEEVMPYLRVMSAGRGLSEERLKAIAKHYEVIGGASPYNAQALDFKERLEKELCAAGIRLPVFLGMKNWNPFLKDVLPEIYRKGLRHGLAIPLTPYRSSSSGAGYQESLRSVCTDSGIKDLHHHFIEGWHDQQLFIEAEAEEISRGLQVIGSADRARVPILFSFHSLPVHHDPVNPISRHDEEARAASALVAERLGHKKWAVVYQSRPASAKETWLGPEIEGEVRALAAKGEKNVLVVPLGFICDHAEVLYDLDHQTRLVAEGAGMRYLRSGTVLGHPKIVTLLKELIRKSMVQGIETHF
jgi:ferrochelatase